MKRLLLLSALLVGLLAVHLSVVRAAGADAALAAAHEAAAAGNNVAALRGATKALRQASDTPTEVAAYALMAAIYARTGRADDASVSYFEILARQPNFELPADATAEERSALAAARDATEAPPSGAEPSEAAKLLAMAELAYEELDYEQVMPLLRRALKQQPDQQLEARIYALMAYLSMSNGKARLAKRNFIRALEVDPDFDLPIGGSPKLHSLLEAARKEIKRRASASEAPRDSDDTRAAPTTEGCPDPGDAAASRSRTSAVDPMPELLFEQCSNCGMFYSRWWFWTIVGTVLAGTGASVAIMLTQPVPVPNHDYGPIELR